MMIVQKLRDVVNDIVVFFLNIVDIIFVVSLLMFFLGWFGYLLIDNYTITKAIKEHIHIITAIESPFNSISTLGKIYGLLDLISTWLFFPTIISIIISRGQIIKQNFDELFFLAYRSKYDVLIAQGKLEEYANKEAIKSAKKFVNEFKKEMKKN